MSTTYFTGILNVITLSLHIKLERTDILILKFSISEHEMPLHLFIYLLYSFFCHWFNIVFIIFLFCLFP